MDGILMLLQRGFAGGIVTAVVFAGFAGFLYLAYQLIKFMRPQEVRQDKQRVLSHRFYKVSGRGRVAYIILCLEVALQFYKQDLPEWDVILRKLWSVTVNNEGCWIDAWVDDISELLPEAVLTDNSDAVSEAASKTRKLYIQAGYTMIVINAILENVYRMVAEWSADTKANDPDGLYHIDAAEEIMKKFAVPLPPDEIVELLLTKQRGSSLGAPFDGLQYSCLVKK